MILFLYNINDKALEKVAHEGYGVSICGDIQNPAGYKPEQPPIY